MLFKKGDKGDRYIHGVNRIIFHMNRTIGVSFTINGPAIDGSVATNESNTIK